MGLTKSEIYTDEQNRIAAIAKVLGHPARIAILQHLIKVQECICGDLVDIIGLSQPTISQHLKEMKSIGLIKGNIDGTKVCYCIDRQRYKDIKKMFDRLLRYSCGGSYC
jgi:DNA-binding transcriptional ArsR family regulator